MRRCICETTKASGRRAKAWDDTLGFTTTHGCIRPWATVPRGRCSVEEGEAPSETITGQAEERPKRGLEANLFWPKIGLDNGVHLNRAFAALRANPEAWGTEQNERHAWDITLADGLEPE